MTLVNLYQAANMSNIYMSISYQEDEYLTMFIANNCFAVNCSSRQIHWYSKYPTVIYFIYMLSILFVVEIYMLSVI
jgi:hypothetical protein